MVGSFFCLHKPVPDVGLIYNHSKWIINRWAKNLTPEKHKRRPWLKIDLHRLAQDIRDFPDAYHYERAARLGVSSTGIFDAMKRIGVTYKKSDVPPQSGRRKTAHLPR